MSLVILGAGAGWAGGPLDARPRTLRLRLAPAQPAALKAGQPVALRVRLTREQTGKHYALRVRTASDRPPAALKVNGAEVEGRPVHGRDGWYTLIPASKLVPGENTLEVTPPAKETQPPAEIELASLEGAAEAVHFRQIFSGPALMAQPPSDPDQLKFDVLHYDLSVVLDMGSRTLTSATLTMQARSLDPALTRVPLDLSANGGALVVSAVDAGTASQPLVFVHDAASARLIVTPAAPLAAGQEFTVRVFYHGTPQSGQAAFNDAYGRTTHGSGVPIISTLSEPYGARVWWPCKDIPEDKATMDLHVTCPTDYSEISNGSLIEVADRGDGTHTYHWRETYPMATYLASVTCTNFQAASAFYTALDGQTTMTLTHYVYPENYGSEGPSALAGTRQIMEFYAQTFGEYPFLAEKYADVHFPDGGAMEHQTCTSILPGLIGNDGLDTVNAHELAHQWFGDKVTMRHFDHIWLNEGFATYCEALFAEHRFGSAAYHNTINSAYTADSYPLVGPQADAFNSAIIYNKGAWVLHMLRHIVGDAAFFQALRNYINDPALAYGTALSSDFQAHVEAASGRALGWFFNEWLYRAVRPNFNWAWWADNSGTSHALYLWVQQSQSGEPYTMPVDLRIGGNGADQTRTIFIDRAKQVFKLDLGALSPGQVSWDPDHWVLGFVTQLLSFPAKTLWTSASTLDFGIKGVHTFTELPLRLECAGAQPLTVTALGIGGMDAAAFSTSAPLPTFDVKPGAAQGVTVTVRFNPFKAQAYNDAILIINTDAGEVDIFLRGTGKANQAQGWSAYL